MRRPYGPRSGRDSERGEQRREVGQFTHDKGVRRPLEETRKAPAFNLPVVVRCAAHPVSTSAVAATSGCRASSETLAFLGENRCGPET